MGIFSADFLRLAKFAVLPTVLIMKGCAAVPSSKFFGRPNTYVIAQAIRCEMKDAIIKNLINALYRTGEADLAQEVASSESAREKFVKGGYKAVKNDGVRTVIGAFIEGQVAYDMEFDITEQNDVGASVDVLSTLSRGTISLSPGARFNGKRRSDSTFRMQDGFGELIYNAYTAQACRELKSSRIAYPENPNLIYPITGKLGLEAPLDEFFSLNMSANLIGTKDHPNIPTSTFKLEFTTTLEGGLEPELKLNPLNSRTEITGGKLTLSGKRIDMHNLTLVFSIPPLNEATLTKKLETVAKAARQGLDEQRQREIDDTQADLNRRLLQVF